LINENYFLNDFSNSIEAQGLKTIKEKLFLSLW